MRSLRSRFITATILIVAATAVSGAGALWSTATLKEALTDNLLLTRAIRNQGSADMMHDALRGDVYRALHAARTAPAERAPTEAAVAAHLNRLREDVAANRALDLDGNIAAALAALEAPLERYGEATREVVRTAFTDPAAAQTRLADFDAQFAALEEAMEAASDRIEAAAAEKEAATSAASATADWMTRTASGLALLVSALLTLYLLRGVLRPLRQITASMDALAAGDTGREVDGIKRADELGSMARAVQIFRQNAIAVARLTAEQEQAKADAEARRVEDLFALADQLDRSLRGIASAVSGAAADTEVSAHTVSQSVISTREQAGAAAAASQQAAANVQTASAAAEELTASFAEVAEQVARAATIARVAAEGAGRTSRLVVDLSAAAQRVGEVVSLIETVAAQTNLLALNATIEAARAGEAGKGFAVVAQEVKVLAAQTATATTTIAQQIEAMQAKTAEAVIAIEEIQATVRNVDQISGAIAAAVEEQQAATREIAMNVSQAAAGTEDVTLGIERVGAVAGTTASASQVATEASTAMRAQADALVQSLESVLTRLRAA